MCRNRSLLTNPGTHLPFYPIPREESPAHMVGTSLVSLQYPAVSRPDQDRRRLTTHVGTYEGWSAVDGGPSAASAEVARVTIGSPAASVAPPERQEMLRPACGVLGVSAGYRGWNAALKATAGALG